MSLWPTMCRGSSCGGLPSAGTIQPRCCPHGCFFRVITASILEVRCGQNCGEPVSHVFPGVVEQALPCGICLRAAVAEDLRASFWSLPRPFLGLELVQRRPYGCRADPLGAAVHIFDAAAPHHPVFARANPGAPALLPHAPVLPPPTAGVTLRRVGQLLVRKNRALQSQEDAQSTLKVIGP